MGQNSLGDIGGDRVEVDAVPNALRTTPYPKDTKNYSVRGTTGIIGPAISAGGTLFSIREATNPVRNVYINGIWISLSCAVAFTAAAQQLFAYERFNTATPSGGAAQTPMKHRFSDPASEVVDIRCGGGLTMAGVVFDGNQVPILEAASPAAAQVITAYVDLKSNPIILAGGEGLCVRNIVVWPAAGTAIFGLRLEWEER